MKVEDFPSLTEMKGGISSISGVEELVSVMQKQKDCAAINVDVFKQRSTVLSIISATEKKAYLDHFVQLEGLNYLHEWLMQAQKSTDCAVEEFVNTLLKTIERLQANLEEFISSAHGIAISPYRESGERTAGEESVCNESHHSSLTRCSESSRVENNTKFTTSNQASTVSSSNSTCFDEARDCNSSGSSLVLNSCQEKFSAVSSACPTVGDARVDSLEIEIEKLEGYKCTSPSKETFDLSSSSTLSTSMPLEECLNHVPQNLGELSGLKNVEFQENGLQCPTPEFLRTYKETSRAGDRQEIVVDMNLKPSLHVESTALIGYNPLGSKSSKIAQKSSAFGLEEEEMDALEVARRVAKEAELEVVGYREHLSNSPDVLCGEATGALSPDLDDGIQDKPGLNVGKFSTGEYSFECISRQLSDRVIDDQIKHRQVSVSPRMIPAAKEQNLGIIENSHCVFDLNEDIYKGEIECSASAISTDTAKTSTPVVVFASKGIPRLPVSSVQSEVRSGWRGYSATSAFRPVVSPKKTPDGESRKQKRSILEIDLNATESQNDGLADPASLRQIPVSSGHLLRDSSMEVRLRKMELLKLDLNLIGDEDVAAKPSLNSRLQLHDVDHSLPAASSSCSKQYHTRNFDLNHNPTTLLDADSPSHRVKTTEPLPTRRSSELDDYSIIKLMGLKLPVDRKLCKNQSQHKPSFNNGMADNILPSQPKLYYPQTSPAYGYNNVLQAGFPSATRQLSVAMNVTMAPLCLSGSFPTVARRTPCEAGRRNVEPGFNHLFTGKGKPEEKLITSLQSSSSLGMVLKRKEPESRLEGQYPFGFKQIPFWK